MLLTLERRRRHPDCTVGELWLGSRRLCWTLEDPVREQYDPRTGTWLWDASFKRWGETAIPSGNYRVTLEDSPRFGPDTITINGVPDFAHIRIHAGNTANDTHGCPLVGLTDNGTWLGQSRDALAIVKRLVKEAIERGEEVFITVVNQFHVNGSKPHVAQALGAGD